ncbi:ribosomal protein L7/L12 [Amycolatopsis orientalis]|uniref:ribosomal protein L7/L12 n=1 Tax=Amycolatopsis orientalis TaxID=31958 RepID=UPI0009DBE283
MLPAPRFVTPTKIDATIRHRHRAFSVTLVSPGNKKIQVIKVVREIVPGLMLKEAMDLVEHSPFVIEAATSAERAEQIRAMLAAVGAGVHVAPYAA